MAGQMQERYQDTELYKIRHSAAHVMAQAVLEMFPEARSRSVRRSRMASITTSTCRAISRLRISSRSKNGCGRSSQGKHEFKKTVVSAEKAARIFADQPYKLELIEGLEKGGLDEYGNPLKEKPEISIYQQDTFRGPVPRAACGEHTSRSSRTPSS